MNWQVLARLPEDVKRTLCQWLSLGIVYGDQVKSAYVTLDGSLILTGDIADTLMGLNVGRPIGDGVLVEGFFNMPRWIIDECGVGSVEEGPIEVNLIGMRVFGLGQFSYIELGDLVSGYIELIRSYGKYISGTFVDAAYRSWGLAGLHFDEQVDLVVVTTDEVIAHHLVDVRRSRHRGFTISAKYLSYGFDRSILMHPYISEGFHSEVALNMLNRSDTRPVGYIAVDYDGVEIIGLYVYKWPQVNPLPMVSRIVAERNMAIRSVVKMR